MSFIIVASEYHFYGIVDNEEMNDSQVFLHFLCELFESISKCHNDETLNFWMIMDKTAHIQEFAIRNKIKMLTILPYTPSLNAAVNFIQGIKARIKKQQRIGR